MHGVAVGIGYARFKYKDDDTRLLRIGGTMSATEKVVRYAAVIIFLMAVVASEDIRDWLLVTAMYIAYFFVSVMLVSCVLIPDKVAEWLRSRWPFGG